MTRRRWLALGFFAAPLLGVAAACTFPDVTYVAAGSASSTPDSSASDAAESADAVGRTDATSVVSPDACAGIACDCDNDGYLSKTCDASTEDVANKKTGDCDDLDPLRNPGASYVYDKPTGTNDGDWNCDGVVEYLYPRAQECKAGPFGPVVGCTPAPGTVYAGTPGCGESQPTSSCQQSNASCAFVAGDSRPEACR